MKSANKSLALWLKKGNKENINFGKNFKNSKLSF